MGCVPGIHQIWFASTVSSIVNVFEEGFSAVQLGVYSDTVGGQNLTIGEGGIEHARRGRDPTVRVEGLEDAVWESQGPGVL